MGMSICGRPKGPSASMSSIGASTTITSTPWRSAGTPSLESPGLMECYRKGRVALVNAPGTGVSDDKAIYAYVPKIINYYLAEEPLLPNVPTYVCWETRDRTYVLEHLDELVVKATGESGGYGMMIGPHASQQEREEYARRIENDPRNFIAQPTLALSRVP